MHRVAVQVGGQRIQLHRSEPHIHVLPGPLCAGFWHGPEVLAEDLVLLLVQVRVGADALVHHAAKQVVNRLPRLLADDIPAGDLKAADQAHCGQIRVHLAVLSVNLAEHLLNGKGALADDVILRHIHHHPPQRTRIVGVPDHLAPAAHIGIRDELQQKPVNPSLCVIAHFNRVKFYIYYFHMFHLTRILFY